MPDDNYETNVYPDPVPPVPAETTADEQPCKKNTTLIVILLISALIFACICFILGIAFGIWAWENGDNWVALQPMLALIA